MFNFSLTVTHTTQAEPHSVAEEIPVKLHGNIPDDCGVRLTQKAQQLFEIQSQKGS